jgi:hypothetical protein
MPGAIPGMNYVLVQRGEFLNKRRRLCYELDDESRTLAITSRMIHVPMMDTAVRLNT